jgi:uncharacterized protein (DUF1330 family)
MKYYAVAEIDIKDPSWVRAYVENVTGMVERRGGRYLARTAQIEKREGDRTPPQIFLIIEWPSPPPTSSTQATSTGPTSSTAGTVPRARPGRRRGLRRRRADELSRT